MNWPPHFVMDLNSQNALPCDWAAQVHAATHAPERLIVQSGADVVPGDEKFSILEGAAVRARFDWLWHLYIGPLRAFVAARFGRPVYPSNRISSAITLNILEGVGAETDWHTDANAVTGVFYAAVPEVGLGGELEFRHPGCPIAQIHPREGAFICFPGSIEHRVAPLRSPKLRLAFVMLFYDSSVDQPLAKPDDRHELSVEPEFGLRPLSEPPNSQIPNSGGRCKIPQLN